MLLFFLSIIPIQQLRQSETAKNHKKGNCLVRLTLVEGAVDGEDVTYLNILNRGSHTLKVTPVPSTPSQPFWKRLFRLRSS